MARKTTTIISCDWEGCRQYAEVSELNETPENWYQVRQADSLRKLPQKGFEFHSLACVSKWANARRKEVGEKQAEGAGGNGASQPSDHLANLILSAWGTEPEQELTMSEIRTLIGYSGGNLSGAILALVDGGSIIATDTGKRGPNPHYTYRRDV